MALMGMREVSWGFGGQPLLENITFQIEKGERVCLVGRNGVGKTTLLKLLCREKLADTGEVWCSRGVTMAAMTQDVPSDFSGTLFDLVASGAGETGRALSEYLPILRMPENRMDKTILQKREELHHILDTGDGWVIMQQVDSILTRMGLPADQPFDDLSAGMKRRALFARAVAFKPDVLLLDEPTNHLDIDAIVWMEDFLLKQVKTLMFVTHDRALVRKIANRIMELDRGRLISFNCGYDTYLSRRQALLDAEEKQLGVFNKKLSKEEVWIRKGIKARRTRNEGRVRALKKMREEFKARRQQIGNVSFRLQEAERSGRLVIRAKNIRYSYEGQVIIDNFSTIIMRGDKIGIIGPNGAGKSTLLNLLLKDLAPDTGHVRHGTHLQVAYFDQLRRQLDEEKTVSENIGEGNDFIVFNGEKRHVVSHLQDFLFSPERCRTPVHILSGGEKNRLLLAKLFARPANVLVMDEPTNDLDMETLELLEDLLFRYEGTLLLVSHDRTFLNHVVAGTFVFEGNGKVVEYAGGYDDWLMQRPLVEKKIPETKEEVKTPPEKAQLKKPQKLGYMEKREFEAMPRKIDTLEKEQEALFQIVSDPLFYKKDMAEATGIKARLNEVAEEIEKAYARWEELDRIDRGQH